jgi:hypothetical protein
MTGSDQPSRRERSRRLAVLLLREDVEDFGRRIVDAHPSVRFMTAASGGVLRSMPAEAPVVRLMDALLNPGLDLPNPELRNARGMLINIVVPTPRDDELESGDLSTVFNETDPGHVAFVDAVFRAMREATKPHVEYLDKAPAPVRIGAAAERWWLEGDNRSFRDAGNSAIYYRVRGQVTLPNAD